MIDFRQQNENYRMDAFGWKRSGDCHIYCNFGSLRQTQISFEKKGIEYFVVTKNLVISRTNKDIKR